MALKVAVSPFYGGDNWTDELTGVTFEKSQTGLSIYDLTNVEVEKLGGIRKALRLNALILIEGELGVEQFTDPVEEVQAEVPAVEPEPVQEAEEPQEEVVEVEVKKPASKKK